MKEITSNKKYVLSMVDPDEVFDILGKSDGKGLFCRCIKGKYQAATHELKYLKVADIKNYIEDAKNNDPNEFIIFYRVVEKKGECQMLMFTVDNKKIKIPLDILEKADRCCDEFDCDDPKNPCPFKEGGQYDWFKYYFDHGCPDIFERFYLGEYRIEIKEV